MGFFDKLKRDAAEETSAIETESAAAKATADKERPKKKKASKKIEIKPAAPKRSEPHPEDSGREMEVPEEVGQLAIDVYETEDYFIVRSTIAGVKAEDLDISVDDGVLTIRGKRRETAEEEKPGKYYYQECFWGSFAREVILPEEVDTSRAEASVKNGVLTLKLPKTSKKKKKKIAVKQIE